jgi:hypothetical protein
MSNEIRLGKGARRAPQRIRWSRGEILSLIMLAILSLLAVMFGSWVGSHHVD